MNYSNQQILLYLKDIFYHKLLYGDKPIVELSGWSDIRWRMKTPDNFLSIDFRHKSHRHR